MRNPVVSIVTPCYNAANYLPAFIESIMNQSFQSWELIIVDDCSSDNSLQICQEYMLKDARIKVHQLQKNSGTCKLPRDTAVSLSKGEWISACDADDYIEENFLSALIERQAETGADIVCPKMVAFDENENVVFTVPKEGFDYQCCYSAEEAFELTADGFNICLAGALIKRDIWINGSTFLSGTFQHVSAKEYAEREMLSMARKVACKDVRYMYRQHSESICHNTKTAWEFSITAEKVLELAKARYGSHSHSYSLALCSFIRKVEFSIRNILKQNGTIPEALKNMARNITAMTILRSNLKLSKKLRYSLEFYKWNRQL